MADDELQHFGVKGMKWGHRKSGGVSTSSSSRVGPSEDAIRSNVHKAVVRKGGVAALSNKDLEDLVKRMNLEKQFSTLQPPSGGKKAKKFIAETLANVGKQQLNKAINDQVNKRIAAAIASR